MTYGADETKAILRVLAAHGGRGLVWVATPGSADEAAFVLTPEGAAALMEGPASQVLTEMLHRKVFVGTRPPWPDEALQEFGTIDQD